MHDRHTLWRELLLMLSMFIPSWGLTQASEDFTLYYGYCAFEEPSPKTAIGYESDPSTKVDVAGSTEKVKKTTDSHAEPQPAIVLSSTGEVEDSPFAPRVGWKLFVDVDNPEEQSKCWIDWNNDGIKSEGEEISNFGYKGEAIEHPFDSKKITIYGPISLLLCDENSLISIDISGNESLKVLSCERNNLSTIDLSKGQRLTSLALSENPIYEIDLSPLKSLTRLGVASTKLTTLDLSQNMLLEHIDLSYLKIGENLDLSHLSQLQSAGLLNMDLKQLNISGCEMLRDLAAPFNNLEEIDLSHCPKLVNVNLNMSPLKSIDLTNLKELVTLHLEGVDLSQIDITHCPKLKYLNCYQSAVSELDLSSNENLMALAAGSTHISRLDLSNCPSLKDLQVNLLEELETLDLSHNPKLEILYAAGCKLTEIDLSNLTQLKDLKLGRNKLSTLDVSKSSNLKSLSIEQNALSNLTLGEHPLLQSIHLFSNELSEQTMERIVSSLSSPEKGGAIFVIDTKDEQEKNYCNKEQVSKLKGKNWRVYDYKGGDNMGRNDFAGLEVANQDPYKADIAIHVDPSTGRVTIEIPESAEMKLYSYDGRLLYINEIQAPLFELPHIISSGVYIVSIVTESGHSTTAPIIIR